MITADSNFISAVTQTSRQFKAQILCDGTALSGNIANFVLYKGASGDRVLPGAVYVPYMEASIRNCSTVIEGETIVPKISIVVGHDSNGDPVWSNWVQLGSFIATKPTVTADTLSFKAVANLGYRGGIIYSSELEYPASVADVISEIATQLSTTISLKGLSASGTINDSMTGITLREALGYVAGIFGGFATEDNTGGIIISKYGAGDTLVVDPWRSQKQPEFSESDWECTGITVQVSEDKEEEDGTITPGISYTHGTPNIYVKNPYMTLSLFEAMYPNIEGVSLSPCEIDMQIGEPRLEPWDKLLITDMNGDEHTALCLTLTQRYHGGFESYVSAEIRTETEEASETTGPVTAGLMQAISDADAAKTASASAISSASTALDAATTAKDAALSAETAADAAETAAASATKNASVAYGRLEEIEKVFDTLSWISQHGDYVRTEDDTVIAGKFYFELSGDEHIVVSPDEDADPSALGLYELVGVDAAVSNYISTHLALDGSGLWVQTDGTEGRILVGSDGVYIYKGNDLVASYEDAITLGNELDAHIKLSVEDGLQFWQGDESASENLIAYIDDSKLYISSAEITENLRIGPFLWKVQSANRISLIYYPS